jgi:hypothetical protein
MHSKLQIALCVSACVAYILITALTSVMSARSVRMLRESAQTYSVITSNITIRVDEHERVLRALVQSSARRDVQK